MKQSNNKYTRMSLERRKRVISVLVPTYNESQNILIGYERIKNVFLEKLQNYDYEIIYIDNDSQDDTLALIESIAKDDVHVRAIVNAKNFGAEHSLFYGLTQCYGDAVCLIFADMQDPPELIETFVREWEDGGKVVVGIKTSSRENFVMYHVRSLFYWLMRVLSEVDQIPHCTGFGLYDQSFIEVIRRLDDPAPYFRGIVAELGYDIRTIPYRQNKRERGKSSYNIMGLYNVAMRGLTSYTKFALRLAIFAGAFIAVLSAITGFVTLVAKLLDWETFPKGIAFISVVVCFIGSIQLVFLGVIGEYILNINTRVLKRPLVVERKRMNWK